MAVNDLRETITRAQQGDENAGRAYDAHVDAIFRCVRHDPDLLTPSCCRGLPEHGQGLRGTDSGAPFEAWLYRIAAARSPISSGAQGSDPRSSFPRH
jgi:hypothetical protein